MKLPVNSYPVHKIICIQNQEKSNCKNANRRIKPSATLTAKNQTCNYHKNSKVKINLDK
jgi:hypothetical protein